MEVEGDRHFTQLRTCKCCFQGFFPHFFPSGLWHKSDRKKLISW